MTRFRKTHLQCLGLLFFNLPRIPFSFMTFNLFAATMNYPFKTKGIFQVASHYLILKSNGQYL